MPSNGASHITNLYQIGLQPLGVFNMLDLKDVKKGTQIRDEEGSEYTVLKVKSQQYLLRRDKTGFLIPSEKKPVEKWVEFWKVERGFIIDPADDL